MPQKVYGKHVHAEKSSLLNAMNFTAKKGHIQNPPKINMQLWMKKRLKASEIHKTNVANSINTSNTEISNPLKNIVLGINDNSLVRLSC